MDIYQIEPGEDFVEVINRTLSTCAFAVITIGPNWLHATDASGKRRLDNAEDFVRMEIVAGPTWCCSRTRRGLRLTIARDATLPLSNGSSVAGGGDVCRQKTDSARLWKSNEPPAMTLIEVRPHRWGWKVFEALGVEPVFPEKRQAIDYAQCRASFRSGEIRILDSTGKIERTIAFNEKERRL